ncbi:MAG: hypothetical protein J6S69_03210, partial [Proteobacteria bacterium]|nr:hypothetical protein [Pseudomonadota bacterium]
LSPLAGFGAEPQKTIHPMMGSMGLSPKTAKTNSIYEVLKPTQAEWDTGAHFATKRQSSVPG